MNELVVFKFQDKQQVRTVRKDGETWFVAKDIAEALGYAWHRGLMNHIPEEWKGVIPVDTLGGKQEMQCLSEQGLYFFLGRSDKPLALPFQKWLAGEVVPSIRKTGSYSVEQYRKDLIAQSVQKHHLSMDLIKDEVNPESKIPYIKAYSITGKCVANATYIKNLPKCFFMYIISSLYSQVIYR